MNWTIQTAALALRNGTLRAEELTRDCLARITKLDSQLQAWAHVDADGAILQAQAADRQLAQKAANSALLGIPIGIKDIIDVAEMPTTAGSKRWANAIARQDAECVRRLRQLGAIIVGKTVTTPFALFDPPATCNPWDHSRTPGGSSSGSAVAVAAGMCVAALGTQTGGSLTRPASYCGVAALKPTYDHISRAGVVPLAPSYDHVGIIAKTAADLQIVYQAITQKPNHVKQKNGPVICWHGMFHDRLDADYRAELIPLFEQLKLALQQAMPGLLLLDREPFPGFEDCLVVHQTIMDWEIARTHGQRFARYPQDYPPKITEVIQRGQSKETLDRLGWAFEQQGYLRDAMEQVFEDGSILITPATNSFPPKRDSTGSPMFHSPFSMLGVPTLSLPLGWSKTGLPLAIQLIAGADQMPALFQFAKDIQQILPVPTREVESR